MSAFGLSRVLGVGLAAVLGCGPALAQSTGHSAVLHTSDAAIRAYWTPERILSAKPNDPKARLAPGALRAPAAVPGVTQQHHEGVPPSQEYDPSDAATLAPDLAADAPAAGPEVHPRKTSSYGAYFTTGRVSPKLATLSYPASTVGKLFFTDPKTGNNRTCSGAVIAYRLVITAGHCLASAATNPANQYDYTNFLFVPAYRAGAAPFNSWTFNGLFVTGSWINSDGSVPNPQDDGILVAKDRTVGGKKMRIGDAVGSLGWVTGGLSMNAVTMLGYPCNLDSCNLMEITSAQTFASSGSNTYTYGTAFADGSSGAPWIQDFGVNPQASPNYSLGRNWIVGVGSFAPNDTTQLYMGASQLDSEFTSLYNLACGASTSGNC